MNVRLTQLDGKLPNHALMRLSAHHRALGDAIHFHRTPYRQAGEPAYGVVYGSAIFDWSIPRVEALSAEFPGAILGGSGSGSPTTVEDVVGAAGQQDYTHWPLFTASIGYSQRGCRLRCRFCVVPRMEGANREASTIYGIWRGDGHPRNIHLLDNDFFGQTGWRGRAAEIVEGRFKVCFSQGINVRLIDDDAAAALATIRYSDDTFTHRRLYTAWDNIGDERIFFAGVDRLERAGVPPHRLMAYMLLGYDPREDLVRILHRFDAMRARGIEPYPMVYLDGPIPGDPRGFTRKQFQRWALRRIYKIAPWSEYDPGAKGTGRSTRKVPAGEGCFT